MAQIIVMPALGNTVESCLVSSWQVAVGDTIDAGTIVAEIETDKAAMDLPAGVAGTVLALLAGEGDEVPVKSPFLIVGAPGEDIAALLAEAGAAPAAAAAPAPADEPAAAAPAPAAQPAPTQPTARADASASPRAKALAQREGLPLDAVAAGTGPHGRVIERDVAAAIASGPRTTAATRGQDVAGVQGTGLGGRVTSADLAAPAPASGPLADLVEGGRRSPAFPGAYTDAPLKGIRKIVAERMMNALAVSAQLTYNSSAAASGLLALRSRFKGSDPGLGYSAITIGDLISYATVRTLKRHAGLNAHLLDGTLRTFDGVHLGLAVDTPRGLLVPTIRNADTLTLRELSAATKELAAACISGKVDPDLLSGATFTISNLGSFGIESFTPIINVPQTGILGVDTIFPRPVIASDGTVGAEQRLGLSLTADHQVVDGADAARFLRDLTAALENIDLVVMG